MFTERCTPHPLTGVEVQLVDRDACHASQCVAIADATQPRGRDRSIARLYSQRTGTQSTADMGRTDPPGLLTPITIRGRTLRNRIVMPPMASHLSPPDGSVTQEHLDRYVPRAAAGVGLVMIEHCYVVAGGRTSDDQLGIHDDALIDASAPVAKRVELRGPVPGGKLGETGRIDARFDGNALGYQGTALLSGSIRGDEFYGWASLPNGADPSFQGARVEPFEGSERGTAAMEVPEIDLPFIRPMMDYGRSSLPEQPAAVVVRNATVWTQGAEGRMENADLLVEAGKVVAVGQNLDAPRGAMEIDATGKHVTPGLIDPHIHSGVSSVNESGFAIVPEVQMGDVVTHNNIWMYRQLAGGLTSAHIKHGSANPIGGENVIVKMRWGALPEDLKLENPPRTVKFALGENPKRRQGRYPDTRMGTQEIIRDHFMAARDYEREWQRWEADGEGIPPRRDLRMEAILDILGQELLISSHGYRADEFLALVRLAEEFGFRVQTLQHGVEAYKIAPELAESNVAAVVWSDWGAFKLEAYDATAYNARILIEAGVTTSLHSDNSQIASRMNWEAGKLLRTGLTEEQALSTVTDGAAKAIAIHDRVGSLEPGKDGDFVIWNGNPLSQFTRAEQTWVDGRRYFSLEEDAVMRDQIESERNQLIQAVLSAGGR
jgi:imidazolonepropionase-like amidohydrolase